MAVLTERMKMFIVERLACYDSAREICDAFKEAFEIDLPTAQVYNYDPSRANYDQSPKWRELFDRTRTAFLADIQAIGIAQKTVRLHWLNDMAQRARTAKNYVLAASILEQAAKEMGEAYTNKRSVASNVTMNYADKSPDELRREIVEDMLELGLDADLAKVQAERELTGRG